MANPNRPANRLPLIRGQRGMTQQELAKRTKLSFSTIQKIEYMKQNVTISTAQKLANALGSTVEELFPNGGGQ